MSAYLASNLLLLRKRRNRTQDDVALACSIKRPTYTHIEAGKNLPSLEVLISLSDFFKVSIDTLLRVELSSLTEFQLSELERGYDVYIRGSQLRILSKTTDNNDNENIELVPHKAKAGYTTGYADPEYINELPRFQLPFLSKKFKYRSFQIQGDSMLPIPENSWITCEYVQDWYSIQSGKPYIILTLNDGIVFKIVDNLVQSEGLLRLYSLNSLYQPYDVSISDVKEVWKFVNYISSEIPEAQNAGENINRKILELTREIQLIKKNMKF